MRIGSLPATTVSPTTANSGPRPLRSHGRQSASTTMLRTLTADRGLLVPTSLNASRPVFCDSIEGRLVDEEWVRSKAGVDAHAIADPALLVVNAETYRLTRWRHAPAFLHRCHAGSALPRSLEMAAEDQLLVLAGEGKGRGCPDARYGDWPQPEAADDRLREVRVEGGVVAARPARARGGPGAQGWGTHRDH